MIRSDPAEIAAGHLAAGRVAEAKALFENLLRTEPTHVRALCGMSKCPATGLTHAPNPHRPLRRLSPATS